MSMIENIWLIGIGSRNQENIINDHKSQISILGKLLLLMSSSSHPSIVQFHMFEHCFKVSLKSAGLSVDQTSLGSFGSGS